MAPTVDMAITKPFTYKQDTKLDDVEQHIVETMLDLYDEWCAETGTRIPAPPVVLAYTAPFTKGLFIGTVCQSAEAGK